MVKEEIINFGTIAPGAQKDIEWELTIDPSDVIHFVPDCGCTANPRVDKENNKIIVTYTEDDAKSLNDQQKQDYYPDGNIPISKGITVYLKDGKNLLVFDDNNKTVLNPEKKTVRIGFIGYCNYLLEEEIQTEIETV